MCGRYSLTESPDTLKIRFRVPGVPSFSPNVDWRPTNLAPIVRRSPESPEFECVLARWGLVPPWAKDLKFGAHCINARAETIATAPSFRSAFRHRRALIPLNAFYEWAGKVGHKTKYRVSVPDAEIFAVAGLWERWVDKETGEVADTYTIITTPANDALAPIHDRMPVILRRDDEDTWLDRGGAELLVPWAGATRLMPV